MAKQVQFRRGTTSQTASFTGATGEITVDTDKDCLIVHDGSTAGGHEIPGYTLYADLLNGQADGVGNIGSSTTGFNTVHAKSTSAQYADVAEKYSTDAIYEAGTVVVIGGDAEATECTTSKDHKVLGIISTEPAVKMNQSTEGQDVALLGRVPCKVVGQINRGDLLVTSATPGHAESWDGEYAPGSIVGKALEAKDTDDAGVIEVAVGRF
jgi:hypothetical protein